MGRNYILLRNRRVEKIKKIFFSYYRSFQLKAKLIFTTTKKEFLRIFTMSKFCVCVEFHNHKTLNWHYEDDSYNIFFYFEGIAIAYVYNYADTKLESPWKSWNLYLILLLSVGIAIEIHNKMKHNSIKMFTAW